MLRLRGVIRISMFALLVARAAPAQRVREIVAALPAPSGRFRVGTTVDYLVDGARRDAEFPGGRPIVVQLWYPTTSAVTAPAPYLVERGLAEELLRGPYYGLDTSTLARWPAVRTHSSLGVRVAAGTHPLLTFSVGLGVIRANYTTIAEEMASQGYIIALVESPLAGLFVLPGGRIVTDTTDRLETATGHRAAVTAWAKDVSTVLDRLHAQRQSGALASVVRAIDWSRVGAMGHSSGGVVAITACELDPRVRACADLDGGMASPKGEPMAEFVARGTSKPTLLLRSEPDYGDADFARRGITREQWLKNAEGGRIALDSVVARARAPFWMAKVLGTGHFSFTDGPFVMPTTISRFGGKIIDGRRGLLVITRTLRAFFDQELSGRRGALQAAAPTMPELTVIPPRPI